MKRVLLYGFFGIGNAGNEAMLRAFCKPLREKFQDDIEFVVASRHPSESYDQNFGVRTIPNFEYQTRDQAVGRWLRGLNPDDSDEYLKFINEVASVDLVVIGPGQYLVETGTTGMFKGALGQTLAVVMACQLTSTPLFGLALACEDLKSTWGKLVVRAILPAFSDLTFRDARSVENIVAAGIDLPKHDVLGDLALLSTAAPLEPALAMLQKESIPTKRGPRLAVALRRIYWRGLDESAHRAKIADVVARWVSQDGRDALFVSQNVYDVDGDRDDDRVEAEKTIALIPESLHHKIYRITGKHDPALTEAAYGLCDVTLSARLHGSVFSCKQGTPPVMFAFMDKTNGFFDRLGHPECMTTLDADVSQISSQLEYALANREAISTSLFESVERVRRGANDYITRCARVLEAGRRGDKA